MAYVLVALLAYPAYLGLTGGGGDGQSPSLLSAPTGLESIERGGDGTAVVSNNGQHRVVTVFVPIDESYRYRLHLRSQDGRSLFEADNVESFDGVGTFAVLLPSGSLPAGDYELEIDEVEPGPGGEVIHTFRFPFSTE